MSGPSAEKVRGDVREELSNSFDSNRFSQIRLQVDHLRTAVKETGRDPHAIKVLIKLLVIVDETDEKAQAKEAELRKYASREGAKVLFGGYVNRQALLTVLKAKQDLHFADGSDKTCPSTDPTTTCAKLELPPWRASLVATPLSSPTSPSGPPTFFPTTSSSVEWDLLSLVRLARSPTNSSAGSTLPTLTASVR